MRMGTYRVTSTDPECSLNANGVLIALADQLKTRGVVTDAAFSAAIDAMTDAQFLTFLRACTKKTVKVNP